MTPRASSPVHAQFSFSHVALIAAVVLLLSGFLWLNSLASFQSGRENVSTVTLEEKNYYDDMYTQVVGEEQGAVAGVSAVLPRGEIFAPRGMP